MKMYGTAVFTGAGTDASTSVNVNGVDYIAMIDTADTSDEIKLEEIRDGKDQLTGFFEKESWWKHDVTLVPRASSAPSTQGTPATGNMADVRNALAIPSAPCIIELSGFASSARTVGQTSYPDGIQLNGKALYRGGGTRTMVKGIASMKITVWKPRTIPDSMSAISTTDAYLERLVTEMQ